MDLLSRVSLCTVIEMLEKSWNKQSCRYFHLLAGWKQAKSVNIGLCDSSHQGVVEGIISDHNTVLSGAVCVLSVCSHSVCEGSTVEGHPAAS